MGYGSGGSSLGIPCWYDCGTIYALTWQTVSFEADTGACIYIFNGQPTTPIPFDATAEDYQAAFEALSSVGVGKAEASGDPGNIALVFDRSIVPTLITVGVNTLEFEATPVTPDVFITDDDLSIVLLTPQPDDLIIDALYHTVEAFMGEPAFNITGEGEDKNFLDTTFLLTAGLHASGYQAPDNGDNFPFPSTGQPLSAVLSGIGGSGNVTGILKLWLCIATPAPLPSN